MVGISGLQLLQDHPNTRPIGPLHIRQVKSASHTLPVLGSWTYRIRKMRRPLQFAQVMGRIEACKVAKCGWLPAAILTLNANRDFDR